MARRPTSLADDIESPAPVRTERQHAARFVTVCCKVPTGLQLQLQRKVKRLVPKGLGGVNDYVETEVYEKYGDVYHVFGPSVPAMGGVPDGYTMPHKIDSGYAFTRGVVPVEFWEQWVEQNKLADYVTNHMIFAEREDASAKADAREHEDLKSGLEPLDRQMDSKGRMMDRRIPKPLNGSLARITPDSERMQSREGAEAD
jgi:hypothetical protein